MDISALVSLPVRVPLELCIRGEGGSGVGSSVWRYACHLFFQYTASVCGTG
jgi:hypothetical protein